MAVLSDPDRAAIWAQMMKDCSSDGTNIAVLKAEFLAAVNAADTWADSNAASYNAALPQPFRGAASASLKSRLLAAVLKKRYEKGA